MGAPLGGNFHIPLVDENELQRQQAEFYSQLGHGQGKTKEGKGQID